jgi:hypothetical protein
VSTEVSLYAVAVLGTEEAMQMSNAYNGVTGVYVVREKRGNGKGRRGGSGSK